MEIMYRYVTVNYNSQLDNELKKRQIVCKYEYDENKTPYYMIFYLTKKQKKELSKHYLWMNFSFMYDAECVFTENEINESDYLQMICQNPAIDICNEEECFDYQCQYYDFLRRIKAHHKIQKKPFTIKNHSTNKRKHFYIDVLDHNILFTDLVVKELLQNSEISGIRCSEVLNKNKTVSSSIFQIRGEEIINSDKLSFKYGKERFCKYCGKKNRLIWGINCSPIIVKQELKDDFYETDSVFGGNETPEYIISSKLYKLLKNNKFIQGCSFIPVIIQPGSDTLKQEKRIGKC